MKDTKDKRINIRVSQKLYDSICSFGKGSFTAGVEFQNNYILSDNKNDLYVQKGETVCTKENDLYVQEQSKLTIKELQAISDNILKEKPQEEYKKIATPFQQQKIRDIENKTKNGNYWEDGEEYTRQQLLENAGLTGF